MDELAPVSRRCTPFPNAFSASIKFPRLFLDFICSMSLLEEPKYTASTTRPKPSCPGQASSASIFARDRKRPRTRDCGTENYPRAIESSCRCLVVSFRDDSLKLLEPRRLRELRGALQSHGQLSAPSDHHGGVLREEMDVFKSPMVLAMLEFKWKSYAQPLLINAAYFFSSLS